jgi:hypothetical protein
LKLTKDCCCCYRRGVLLKSRFWYFFDNSHELEADRGLLLLPCEWRSIIVTIFVLFENEIPYFDNKIRTSVLATEIRINTDKIRTVGRSGITSFLRFKKNAQNSNSFKILLNASTKLSLLFRGFGEYLGKIANLT